MIEAIITLSLLLVVAIGLCGSTWNKLRKQKKELTYYKKEIEKAFERITKQNEIIQNMETGTPLEQFDATLDIMHQFAKKQK